MSKYKTKEENRRFLKAALFAHSPYCYFCAQSVKLPIEKYIGKNEMPDNIAVVYGLQNRLQREKGKPFNKVLSCNKCAREESRINFKSVPLSVRQHSSRRGYTILRNMKNKIIGRIVQFISKLF